MFKIIFISFFLNLAFILNVSLYPKNIVIPIKGEIEPSLVKYLKRAIIEAQNQNATNVIFEINTFGGRVDITYEIVDMILEIPLPTIAVVDQKAISAGTLIALASQKLYMKKNSTLGDVAPIMVGQNGPQVLGEKFQSPLRAKFRALALRNGYPVKLSEAFVTDSIQIIEITWKNGKKEIITGTEYNDLLIEDLKNIKKKRTIIKEGELLTMSAEEAFNLGFSQKTIYQLEDAIDNNLAVIYLEKKNSEKALTILVRYSWLLLLLGLGGIYLEVKNPGFGFYGIVSLISFTLFFLGNYIVELANYLELLLLLLGVALLFVEFFILPGFGFIGVGGFVLLFVSSLLMMQSFTLPSNFIEFNALQANVSEILYVFIASGVLFLLSFIGMPKLLSKSSLVLNHMLSNKSEKKKEVLIGETNHDLTFLINQEGNAFTNLRPSGTIKIEDNFFDALTSGEYIQKGETIKVIKVSGNVIYVERN